MPKRTTPISAPKLNPASRPLPKARYAELLRDVQRLVIVADAAVDQQKVVANWNVGRRIARERLALGSGYHNAVLRDLSTDARVAMRTLQYAVKFHSVYPKVPTLPLNWFHYRVLLDRPDAKSRAHYQALAISAPLAARALARRIAEDQRSRVGTSSSHLPRPTEPSYLYRATVEQVIDGDTLDLRIDLGFHTDRHGRFRLAAIDSPELPTEEARLARDFVFARLATAKTVIVKTQRTDIYGRYVAHLFYSDTDLSTGQCFTEGHHLNSELLEAGHAELA